MHMSSVFTVIRVSEFHPAFKLNRELADGSAPKQKRDEGLEGSWLLPRRGTNPTHREEVTENALLSR